MKVVIVEHYRGHRERVFVGTSERVRMDLLRAYEDELAGRLRTGPAAPLSLVLKALNGMQLYSVKSVSDELAKAESNLEDEALEPNSEIVRDMLGLMVHLEAAFDAARFLVGGPPVHLERARHALWQADGDPIDAALRAYGMIPSHENRESLQAVLHLSGMQKSLDDAVPANADVQPALEDGQDVADAVRRAAKTSAIMPVRLGGKHSAGSMVARDPQEERVYLLKPGSGGQSPAAGAQQEGASQSQREAAFWHVAKDWGLESHLPRCELVLVDGTQYAAMDLLQWSYKPLEKLRQQDPAAPGRAFEKYRESGLLHQWAVLDFVCGNPDRHAANIMVNTDREVRLIDHGSAFAGSSFDPAYDQNSFIPYYLRYPAPQGVKMNSLHFHERLRYMALSSEDGRRVLRDWLAGLDLNLLEKTLHRYGVDPAASVERLSRVLVQAAEPDVDARINQLWAGT